MQAMSDDERAKNFATHKRRFFELMKRHHEIGQKAALGFEALKQGPVVVGNSVSEISVVQSAQHRDCERATIGLNGTRDRRVLVK